MKDTDKPDYLCNNEGPDNCSNETCWDLNECQKHRTDGKPDFEKIINEVFDGDSATDKMRRFSALVDRSLEKKLCEKIWNDYVVPRDARIAELERDNERLGNYANEYNKHLSEINGLESEIDRLKSELDKAKQMLTEIDRSLYIGPDLQDKEIMLHYIGVASVIKEEIEGFLKDKK